MKSVRFVVLALLAVLAGGVSAQVSKSDFPTRPVRYIVPFPPGGSADLVARVVSVPLSEEFGRSVVIDNRAGAAGTVGAEIAANAAPDGYTIFACNIASLAVSPALYKKLNYDPVAGFAPVGLIGSTANALAVHPSVPAKSIPEFIAYAKSRPGKVNYASAGVGTSPQLSMEMFRMNAGLNLVHVPYKGAGPALVGLLGGHVEAMFSTVPTYTGALRSGKVRLLAVTSTSRHPDLPDVPTLAESGMPGFEVISWQGMCTPAGVPEKVLARIRSALARALEHPEVKRQLADQGMQLTPLMAEKFTEFVRSERTKWAKVVKDVGIDPQ